MFKKKEQSKYSDVFKESCIFLAKKKKEMLNHCTLGNAVYCVVEIIFNGIIVFICNIFMSFKVFSACFACFIAKKKN